MRNCFMCNSKCVQGTPDTSCAQASRVMGFNLKKLFRLPKVLWHLTKQGGGSTSGMRTGASGGNWKFHQQMGNRSGFS